MKRFAVGLQYLGSPYAGFARTHGRSNKAMSVTDQLELLKGFIRLREGNVNSGIATKASLGVLDVINDALQKMCHEKGAFENLKGSSRTDAGVHGLRNVFHVDINHPSLFDSETIKKSFNYYLEPRKTFIFVTDVTEVPKSFDARFDATARSYCYKILLPRIPFSIDQEVNTFFSSSINLPPQNTKIHHFWSLFHQNRAWVLDPIPSHVSFDPCLMEEAARYLIGEHDFASFQSARCQSSVSIRELFSIQIFHNKRRVDSQVITSNVRSGESPFQHLTHMTHPATEINNNHYKSSGYDFTNILNLTEPSTEEIDILITGDSFLQRMVRNIVGLLVQIGFGKRSVSSTRDILALRDRNLAAIFPAPAHGLYLVDVHYDKERRKIKEQRIIRSMKPL